MNRNNKVLLIQWARSDNDSLRVLLDMAAKELIAMGNVVESVVIDTPDWQQRLMDLLKTGGFGLALGMSGIGGDLMTDQKQYLWEAARIPFFMWYCDHPCYFPARHVLRNPFALQGYVFPDHAKFSREFLNPNGMTFSVHIGIPSRELFGQPLPMKQRNRRLIFSKGAGNPAVVLREWQQKFSPMLLAILQESCQALRYRSTLDFQGTIIDCAQSHGLHLTPASALAMTLLLEADKYIRNERAEQVMRRLMKFPVDVFGGGWDHLEFNSQTKWHGPKPMAEIMRQLPSYVGSVSINPLVQDSVHDRTFCAIQAGVTPIGDRNAFSRSAFPRLNAYQFDFDPDMIEAAVELVLADPAGAIDATDATYHESIDRYGMRAGLQRIIEFSGFMGVNASYAPR